MIQDLPEDLQSLIVSHLPQRDLASLSLTCSALHALVSPLLHRVVRCASCAHPLLEARELGPHTAFLPRPSQHRRACRPSFIELRGAARHCLRPDVKRGAANFHVLRHLSQTVFRNVRFPLPDELRAVRALRCPACAVFVGFSHAGVAGALREFIHHDFVELVDGCGHIRALDGTSAPPPAGTVHCAAAGCGARLFGRDDIQPWTHVLSSSRLTDMDAFLEWDHGWAGAASAHDPAFFVKRVEEGALRIANERAERLRQGDMQVGDAHCAGCGAHVGWKLLAELPRAGQGLLLNYDQVGRFGIIRTAVTPSEPRYA